MGLEATQGLDHDKLQGLIDSLRNDNQLLTQESKNFARAMSGPQAHLIDNSNLEQLKSSVSNKFNEIVSILNGGSTV